MFSILNITNLLSHYLCVKGGLYVSSILQVFELFGPVAHPFYVLRFNSSEHIESKGIKIKDTMYFAPSMKDFTQYVFTEKQ